MQWFPFILNEVLKYVWQVYAVYLHHQRHKRYADCMLMAIPMFPPNDFVFKFYFILFYLFCRLMEMMRTEGLPLNAYTYAAAMTSCDTAGQCDEVLSLLRKMISEMDPTYLPISISRPPTDIVDKASTSNFIVKESVVPITTIIPTTSVNSTSTSTSSYTTSLESENPSYRKQSMNSINTATVPFNIAISATLKFGRIYKAKEIFDLMKTLHVIRNTVTYTTLITGITKSKNFNQRMVLDVYQEMLLDGVNKNAAIYGAVIAAAEKCDDWVLTLNLLEEMKEAQIATSTFVYHSAISACGKAGKYEMTLELLEEMKERRVERTTVTYSLLINACKKSGLWEEAIKFLGLMEKDLNEGVVKSVNITLDNENVSNNESYESERKKRKDKEVEMDVMRENGSMGVFTSLKNNIDTEKGDSREKYMKGSERKEGMKDSLILSGLQPDTIVYSSVISVFVASQQWGLALELLERMEKLGIQRNVVTYNTVIEALSNANETARAEIVYQSALRTGIYNHWHQSSKYYNMQDENSKKNGKTNTNDFVEN